jgi:hypothetical protein
MQPYGSSFLLFLFFPTRNCAEAFEQRDSIENAAITPLSECHAARVNGSPGISGDYTEFGRD